MNSSIIEIDKDAKIEASGIGAGGNERRATPGQVDDINYGDYSVAKSELAVEEPTLGVTTQTTTIEKTLTFTPRDLSRIGGIPVHHPYGPHLHGPHLNGPQPHGLYPHMPQPDSQVININIMNMHPQFLGTGALLSPQGRFMNPFDQNMFDSFSGNTIRQNEWMEIIRGASNKNLNMINIMSQRNAAIALRVVEGALQQVQRELANVSAYIQRFTQNTVVGEVDTNGINYMPNYMLRDNLV